MKLNLKDALVTEFGLDENYLIKGADENQDLTDELIEVELIRMYKQPKGFEVGKATNIKINKFKLLSQEERRVLDYNLYIKNQYNENTKPKDGMYLGHGLYESLSIPEDMLISLDEYKKNKYQEYKKQYKFINDNQFVSNGNDHWFDDTKYFQNKLLDKYGKEYANDVKEYYIKKIDNIAKDKEEEFQKCIEKFKIELKKKLDEKYNNLKNKYKGRIQSAKRFNSKDELVK